jgi:hypothetical protein
MGSFALSEGAVAAIMNGDSQHKFVVQCRGELCEVSEKDYCFEVAEWCE